MCRAPSCPARPMPPSGLHGRNAMPCSRAVPQFRLAGPERRRELVLHAGQVALAQDLAWRCRSARWWRWRSRPSGSSRRRAVPGGRRPTPRTAPSGRAGGTGRGRSPPRPAPSATPRRPPADGSGEPSTAQAPRRDACARPWWRPARRWCPRVAGQRLGDQPLVVPDLAGVAGGRRRRCRSASRPRRARRGSWRWSAPRRAFRSDIGMPPSPMALTVTVPIVLLCI